MIIEKLQSLPVAIETVVRLRGLYGIRDEHQPSAQTFSSGTQASRERSYVHFDKVRQAGMSA